jgi:glyoxylase-like metal-dependent hydrolase (beta-lactamase superfamily II)
LETNLFGTEVAEGVHHIKCPFSRHGYFTSACAIIGKTATLVDSGTPTSPEEAIFPYLNHLGKSPNQISTIILTHAHFDHCGGLSAIKKKHDAKVAVHVSDAPLMADPTLLNRQLNHRFPEIYPSDLAPEYEPAKVDLSLKDGDEIDLEDRALKVIHTPGHSEGSIVLLDEKIGLCISGDSIQGRGERRPLLFSSSTDYVRSLKKLKKKSIRTLILGHPFAPFNKGVLHGKEAEEFLAESLSAIEELQGEVLKIVEESNKPPSLNEICKRIPAAQPSTLGCIVESLSR